VKNQPAEADRSIPELLQKLASETSLLVRQEIELARAELMRTAKEAARPATAFGVAAIFALGAFGALTALLIVAIAVALPAWAAALIVTVLYGVVAAVAVNSGRSTMRKVGSPVPKQTIETINEDVRAVRSGIARGRQ
jgi:uncharacterized membrane protein YqjE